MGARSCFKSDPLRAGRSTWHDRRSGKDDVMLMLCHVSVEPERGRSGTISVICRGRATQDIVIAMFLPVPRGSCCSATLFFYITRPPITLIIHHVGRQRQYCVYMCLCTAHPVHKRRFLQSCSLPRTSRVRCQWADPIRALPEFQPTRTARTHWEPVETV